MPLPICMEAPCHKWDAPADMHGGTLSQVRCPADMHGGALPQVRCPADMHGGYPSVASNSCQARLARVGALAPAWTSPLSELSLSRL
eukprot:365305-Chlamydomonas_euryale.AAC.8